MNLERLIDETEYEHHKRLVYGKLVDKTLDADYTEIAPYLYGREYAPDVARRMMYGSRVTLDILESEVENLLNTDEDDYISSIEYKKVELQKERIKLQTEKQEYNKWVREDAREEQFLEKIIEAMKECSPPRTANVLVGEDNLVRHKEGVLCFADCHYGKEFVIYGLEGEILNQYSPETFFSRMDMLLTETIKRGHENNLNKIKVLFLGDALDGFLRHSQLKTLREGVVDSAISYGRYMSDWLYKLSQDFFVEYYQVCGNHGELRLLDGRKEEHLDDNIEKITFEIIRAYNINNQNLKIVENKSGNIYTNICGYNFLGIHGEFKDSKNAMRDYIAAYDKDIDYLICGHKHHSSLVNCGYRKYVVGIGSIVGIDDYSMKILKTSEASANFLIFEEGKGKTIDYSIILN